MPKFYSVDLRERVLKYLEKIKIEKLQVVYFKQGYLLFIDGFLVKKENGNVEPLHRPYAYKKIDDQKLIDYIEKNPDHFLSEIAKHFNITLQAVFYALKRLKITRKKSSRFIRKGTKKKEISS